MEFYNEYIDNYDEYEINLDNDEIYIDMDEKILMQMKSFFNNKHLYKYSQYDIQQIKNLYAQYAKIEIDNIVVGNSLEQMIEVVMNTKIKKDKKVLILGKEMLNNDGITSKFSDRIEMYDISNNLEFDLKQFLNSINMENIDLIIFSNPNNSTGIAIKIEDILGILEKFKDKIVLIDESYYEFYGESMIPYINRYKNLIVIRSLSKVWGLDCLKIVFVITHNNNINELLKNEILCAVNSYSIKLASIALKYPYKTLKNVNKIIEQRDSLFKELKILQRNAALNIEFYPSNGIFIYGKTPYIKTLKNCLENKKIHIKYFNDQSFRITVGSPMQNKRLLEGIKKAFMY